MARGQFLKGTATYSDAQLRRILQGTGERLHRAIRRAVKNKQFLEIVAGRAVENVSEKEPEFNNYTGNLQSSYVADVFVNGYYQPVMSKYGKQLRGSISEHNGRRRASLMTPTRHGARVRTKLSDADSALARHRTEVSYRRWATARYRYLKPWEKQTTGGYRGTNPKYEGRADIELRSEIRRQLRKAAESETGNKFTAKSYIVIANKAPYADFVQRGGNKSKHYNVLRGGLGLRDSSRYNSLLKIITLKEIESALRTTNFSRTSFEGRLREKYTNYKR